MQHNIDVGVIIVNRDRPDLADALVNQINNMSTKHSLDVYVIEMGSNKNNLSKYMSYYYEDSAFRGKAFGHNQGLQFVNAQKNKYKYYWFLMNDLVFYPEQNPIDSMIDIMEEVPQIGIISPTENDSGYHGSRPEKDRRWHIVSTCDYLSLFMRKQCLKEVGFLNPDFKYSWGAIHELSYKMYKNDWWIAYCDQVNMKHLGGTTYGATKNTISRDAYKQNAKKWAYEYFTNTYGENWDEEFTKYLPEEIEHNTYKIHKALWRKGVIEQESEKKSNDPFMKIKNFFRKLIPA